MNSIIDSIKLKPADCTLACEKGHLTAHKIILCAHSKYLLDILSKFPNADHPIIILTELNITDIRILVNYMYSGELIITSDCSPTSLLRAAQILRIDSLTDFDETDDVVLAAEPNDDDDEHNGPAAAAAAAADQHHQAAGAQAAGRVNGQLGATGADHDLDDLSERSRPMDDDDDLDDDGLDDDLDDDGMGDDDDDDDHHHHHHRHQLQSANNNNYHNLHNSQQQISISGKAQAQALGKQEPLGDNNKIRCHLCNIGLSDVKCLYRHVLTRHLPEKWGYKCEFCDREFSRDDHLMRHYTTKHKNMEFNREKIRETRRLNREMAKNFHDQMSTLCK